MNNHSSSSNIILKQYNQLKRECGKLSRPIRFTKKKIKN